MKWKHIKLGRKFFIAFGLIILLLVVIAYWAIYGIGNILGNAEEVIDGNKLRTDLEHKYVQHLLWAQEVNKLLTDEDITELKVQTDYTLCDFGKWYYGEGKKNAEKLIPELSSELDKFEEPHKHLHESAIGIKDVFVQGDMLLSSRLNEAKCDHLTWVNKLKDAFTTNDRISTIDVQKDPTMCRFGKWLESDEVKELIRNNSDFAVLIQKIKKPHEELHKSAISIERAMQSEKRNEALSIFQNTSMFYLDDIIENLNATIEWSNTNVEGMLAANEIYNTETMKYLEQMGSLFTKVIDDSKKYILTDEAMLSEAKQTRSGVVIFGTVAAILAIIMALVIARGILKPIKKGVELANEVANGNLLAKSDIDQNDEIGELIRSLHFMIEKLKEIVVSIRTGADNIAGASDQLSSGSQELSQGAAEQASSVEEVSSSMEEMVANIQQNTENAQQTEKIALKAAEEIKNGSDATNIAMESMKDIASKISIINEIAFQTNILALNAAVEAARAGEHGKGFAVVAAEVRKLAERSKIAAQEIDEVSKSGVKISEEAGRQLSELVPEIEKTAQLVQEITASSHEQNSGAEQVNNAIQQINQSTQQNAASSEEIATSAEELASQALNLKDIIGYFKIENPGQTKIVKSSTKKTMYEYVQPKMKEEGAKNEEEFVRF